MANTYNIMFVDAVAMILFVSWIVFYNKHIKTNLFIQSGSFEQLLPEQNIDLDIVILRIVLHYMSYVMEFL